VTPIVIGDGYPHTDSIIKGEVCRENNRLAYVEFSKCLRVEDFLNVDSSEVHFASVLVEYLVRVF
jgi:hypothetical protein